MTFVRGLLGGLLFTFGAVLSASAQAPIGKEATVPAPDAPPREFRLEHVGGMSYTFVDGDPKQVDAPRVLAIAGGARLWYDDLYITADNLLIWVDGDSVSVERERKGDQTFPYGVSPPLVTAEEPNEEAFAQISDPRESVMSTTGKLREIFAEGNVYVAQGTPEKIRTGRGLIIQGEKFYHNVIEQRSLLIGGEIRANTESASISDLMAEGTKKEKDRKPESYAEEQGIESENKKPIIPVVIRAAEIRGIAKGLFEAKNAQLTTSTFGKPGYHVAMDRLVYEQRAGTEEAAHVTGYNNRFVLGDVSLLSLPYFTVRVGENPLPLIGFSTGFSSRFGLFVRTRWGAEFQELGDRVNQELGVTGSFKGNWWADIDLFSARGLGLGGGLHYETSDGRKKKYFGDSRFYFIGDSGEPQSTDQVNSKKTDKNSSDKTGPSGLRGQIKTLNRMFLPDDWQLDTEFNYVSDRTFLKDFFPHEFKEEKTPETLAYLKKLDGDSAVTALAKYRLNTWQTQTEYLPQVTYDVISRPIAEFPKLGQDLDQDEPVRLYWTHRSEAAIVGYRQGVNPDAKKNQKKKHDPSKNDATALRVDDIERFNLPFELGRVGIDPYFENRMTFWGGQAKKDGGSGGFREAMSIGANASTQYSRIDPDVESEAWNIHGIRHIVIPSVRYRWTFLSTVAANDLVPFDRVEQFDTLHAIVPGIENRYQTKRMTRFGPETVTFLGYDVQQPFLFENGRGQVDLLGDLHVKGFYRPDLDRYFLRNSKFTALSEFNWNDFTLDRFRAEWESEPGPDLFTRLAYSYSAKGNVDPNLALDGFLPIARPIPTQTVTAEVAYQMTRLWEIVVKQQFGGGGNAELILRRYTADWVFEFGAGSRSPGLGTGFGLTISPVAIFERSGHSRFKTALSDGYDLTPIFDEPEYSSGAAFGSAAPDSQKPPQNAEQP